MSRAHDSEWLPVLNHGGPADLFQQMRDFGPRRLIVGLDIPMRSDEVNRYGPEGHERYRRLARQARREFLDDLSTDSQLRNATYQVEELPGLPYVALLPDEITLQRTLAHSRVISINTESGGPPLLNESVPFIGADTAHNQGHTGHGRAIAIIDTGVDRNHPMFSGKVVSEACYSSSAHSSIGSICRAGGYGSTGLNSGGPCIIERTPCTVDPVDCAAELHCQSGHGSHVAGVASGAPLFPGGGLPALKGVAYGADIISIMPLSHSEDISGCAPAEPPCFVFLETPVAAALNRVYALRHSYDISSVNLSLMLTSDSSDYSSTTCDNAWPSVRDAVNLLTAAGIRVYAASGNEGGGPLFQNKIGPPSCLGNVISVAATSKNSDEFASYANAASILDVLAPGALNSRLAGTTCRDTFLLPDGIWSAYFHTGCSDDYFQDVGTSMASPHAAGAHSVLQDRYPEASATAISNWLAESGTPISFTQGGAQYTRPRINLAAAMTPPAAPSSGPASGDVAWLECYGSNLASWASVAGDSIEYHLQGVGSGWMYYQGSSTDAVVHVSHSEDLQVRACNMVSCGGWTTIGQATYQNYCIF